MKKINFLLISATIISTLLISCVDSSSKEENIDNQEVETDTINEDEHHQATSVSQDFTDKDWKSENLNVEKFRNGDSIPHAKTNEEWLNASIYRRPAWCYYSNDSKNGEIYGKLYNWHAVNDTRGLAPEGWKIPTCEEFSSRLEYVWGERNIVGKKLKSNDFWADNNGRSGNGNNESGFNGLPGGYRDASGNFLEIGESAYWWSSTEAESDNSSSDYAWSRQLSNTCNSFYREYAYKGYGYSVRLVRE